MTAPGFTEADVEIVARAWCVFQCRDPDEQIAVGPPDRKTREVEHRALWQFKAEFARAALRALTETRVLVPVEPTEAMLKAGYRALGDTHRNDASKYVWRAMLAARLTPKDSP